MSKTSSDYAKRKNIICTIITVLGISKNLRESYELLEKFLDFKDSKYAKENNLTHIPMDDVAIKFEKGEEIAMTGGMKATIGAKMLFEKFIGPDGQKYMKIKMCYASADQLRHNTILSPDNPPMFYDLKLEGLQTNAGGFYKYEDVMNRFDEAIQLGNKYCGTSAEQAA